MCCLMQKMSVARHAKLVQLALVVCNESDRVQVEIHLDAQWPGHAMYAASNEVLLLVP